MNKNCFQDPTEILEHDWPFSDKVNKEEVFSLLKTFFGYSLSQKEEVPFRFHEVTRPHYGLVRSVIVVSAPIKNEHAYYTIRIIHQPDRTVAEGLDLPSYQKFRVEQLVHTLKDHYPVSHFIESNEYLIILQKFVFYPVCKFTRLIDIINLLEIMFYASNSRVLLDYNQNHWLTSEYGLLMYCDLDFMGNFFSSSLEALRANINQVMVFLDLNNCMLLPKALSELSKKGEEKAQFVINFKRVLQNFIETCQSRQGLSGLLQMKLKCLSKSFGD